MCCTRPGQVEPVRVRSGHTIEVFARAGSPPEESLHFKKVRPGLVEVTGSWPPAPHLPIGLITVPRPLPQPKQRLRGSGCPPDRMPDVKDSETRRSPGRGAIAVGGGTATLIQSG